MSDLILKLNFIPKDVFIPNAAVLEIFHVGEIAFC